VVNIVNGFGAEAGAALSQSTRIAKLAFTGSTAVGNEVGGVKVPHQPLNPYTHFVLCTFEQPALAGFFLPSNHPSPLCPSPSQ
jgi:hypothetical protein